MVTLNVHPTVACVNKLIYWRRSFLHAKEHLSPIRFRLCPHLEDFSPFKVNRQCKEFINVRGEGGQFINVEFTEHNSVKFDNIWRCNQNYSYTTEEADGTHYWDEFGYELKEECGCNTCEDSCSSDNILYEPPGVLYGFQSTYVLFAWGWAILLSLAITITR